MTSTLGRILIVDDNPGDALLLREMLGEVFDQGLKVETAASLDLARSKTTAADGLQAVLAKTDLGTPGGDTGIAPLMHFA